METTTPEESRHYDRKTSLTEAVEGDGQGHLHAPSFLRWLEIPYRVKHPKEDRYYPEVTGWSMDSSGRGPLNIVGSYVGNAILVMALIEAQGDNPIKWGIKPSSLLTVVSSFMGVVGAILMPVVGAVIDHTRHRRAMGAISGALAVFLIFCQCFISLERNNWFPMLIIDGLQSFCVLVHFSTVLAYLPDLSTEEHVLSHYTAAFNVRQYIGNFIFTALIIAASGMRNNIHDGSPQATVEAARDVAIMSFLYGFITLGYSWTFLLRERPALTQLPKGTNLLTAGFVQVGRTASKITGRYNALRVFMFSLLWSPEAGSGVILSIAVTYLAVDLKFKAIDLAIAGLVLMGATAVGAYIARFLNRVVNPLNSYRLGLIVLGAAFGVTPFLLDEPSQSNYVFALAIAWGASFGWAYPSQRVLFCTLIPKGQETEMMGMFAFMGQILGWLLPLLATIMNQNDVPRKFSFVLIFCFCLLAVGCTLFMGDYREACALVARDSAEKYDQVINAALERQQRTQNTLEPAWADETRTSKPEEAPTATSSEDETRKEEV